MRMNRSAGIFVALAVSALAFTQSCAPAARANSVAVTYYYMPG